MLRSDLQTRMGRSHITKEQRKELALQVKHLSSELSLHWKTMPRNPVENYDQFSRS